jgi:hypothetical protein
MATGNLVMGIDFALGIEGSENADCARICPRGGYHRGVARLYRGDEQTAVILAQILAHRFGFPVAQYRESLGRT